MLVITARVYAKSGGRVVFGEITARTSTAEIAEGAEFFVEAPTTILERILLPVR
jgi:hypothetical protein